MSKKRGARNSGASRTSVRDFVAAMESIAPVGLAQNWDNVGLLVGDPNAPMRRVLLCIDLTRNVVEEAIKTHCEVVMAYHPPIFKAITSLRADSTGTDAAIFHCIANGIAVYSTHTAFDAAAGGTNESMAACCGIDQTEPLEYVDDPHCGGTRRADVAGQAGTEVSGSAHQHKIVVFVPASEADDVANAMFQAGAGHIGSYSNCSYRTEGLGTFIGSDATNPTIGKKGRMEFIDEMRLESIVSSRVLPAVISAVRAAHSYDEPAFDVYPLTPHPVRGIGRVGALRKPIALEALARKLKRATSAMCVQVIGPKEALLERAIIVVGAAGSLPFKLKLTERDVIITGEIRHHDALTIRRLGCSAIALGHWASERPAMDSLAKTLEQMLSLSVQVSEADCDPFGNI